MVGNSGLSYGCSFGIKKNKTDTLFDYVGENLLVNLLPLKYDDMGRRKLDVCMDHKLIKYGFLVAGVRGHSPLTL